MSHPLPREVPYFQQPSNLPKTIIGGMVWSPSRNAHLSCLRPRNPLIDTEGADFMNKRTHGIGLGLLAALAGGLLFFTGCASTPPVPPPPPEPTLYEWHGEGLSGPAKIIIDISDQRAEVFIGGQFAGWATVATGKAGHDTPTGTFKITEKIVDKESSHYGWIVDEWGETIKIDADSRKDRPPLGGRFVHAPMPYWMRLTKWGIGMHAGPIPSPGDPASKGCIRLPKPFAPLLFDAVSVGTPVTIVP